MDGEDVKKKLETGKCFLVAQEGNGKSSLWKTFDYWISRKRRV
jgi:hypothetical protein